MTINTKIKVAENEDSVLSAKNLLAEIHFILLTKEKGHGLTPDDMVWKERSKPFYEERKEFLPEAEITMDLMMARLQGKVYVSKFCNTDINAATLRLAWMKANRPDTEDNRSFFKKVKSVFTGEEI